MHGFSLRDDISVTSARSNYSRATSVHSFTRSFSLGRRKSKEGPHFSDDLSEYSNPSNWGERLGPLSLTDHRLGSDGLQARRTVGEAILRAQWEGRSIDFPPARNESCSTCLGARFPRIILDSLRRREPRPATVFTWAEVDSVLFPPTEENGLYLIVVTTMRCREDGSREWLLQAGSRRARARWGIEMSLSIMQAHRNAPTPGTSRGAKGCICCAPAIAPRIPIALLMDIVRLSCETARNQPSGDGMLRLIEVLDLLMKTQSADGEQKSFISPTPPIPVAALKRFRDTVKQAHADFSDWLLWWEIKHIVRDPPSFDVLIWRTRVLPFLIPPDTDLSAYPVLVDTQLASGAERCHRALCS